MKQYLITLALCLLLCAPSWACDEDACREIESQPNLVMSGDEVERFNIARMSPAILGSGSTATAYSFACTSATSTANTSGLLCEDFDNPTQTDCNAGDGFHCRAAWTGTTANPDFNYDGVTGKALYLDGASADTADGRLFTEGTTDPEYWYFTLRFPALAHNGVASLIIFNVKYNNCGSVLDEIYAYNAGTDWVFRVLAFGGTAALTTATFTTNTTYHVWLKIVRETGDDSVNNASIWFMFNTSATMPTDWATCDTGHSNCAKSVDGTRQAYADCITPVGQYSAADEYTSMYIDNIIVSASEIGSNP